MGVKTLKFFLWLLVISFAACSGDGMVDLGSSSDAKGAGRFRPPGERPEAIDFERECGISPDKASDENAALFSGDYTSFPIIVEGEQMSMAYRVILQAKIKISANAKGSSVQRQISVARAESGSGGFIKLIVDSVVNNKANAKAKANSGESKTVPLPMGEWLKLTGPSGNPELKDLLCVITGAKTSTSITGEGTLSATFTPALVNSVSPLAPPERMRKEVGSGRTFTVTANVTSVPKTGGFLEPADKNYKLGSKTGKITIRETKPVLSVVNQDANINKTISADIAYEVINEFPNGAYTVGLPKRAIYLIDTTQKTLRAIYLEDDRPDPTSGKVATPPIVIVKDK